jgi:hypothetical protein
VNIWQNGNRQFVRMKSSGRAKLLKNLERVKRADSNYTI